MALIWEQLKDLWTLALEWQGVLEIFAIVLGVLVVNFLLTRALQRVVVKVERTESLWDDAVFKSLQAPVRLIVWILGLAFAAELALHASDTPVKDLIAPVRELGIIFCLVWFTIRFITNAEANMLARAADDPDSRLDQTTADAIAKLLKASVIITGVLVAMQTLGINIAGVLAFGGIGGIAVGFAARDMLANFFGGFTVYMDRPFKVGDWIRSPDKQIEGTVEKIGWRSTRIRTFDKRPIYVPNAVFTSIVVENPSRMENRRIYETVGVRYGDADVVGAIVDDVRAMLESHPEIDGSKTLMVFFDKFNASSMDFFVYCFTETTDWAEFHRIKQDILLEVSEIIERHGAEIAFPTRTLHVADAASLAAAEEGGDG